MCYGCAGSTPGHHRGTAPVPTAACPSLPHTDTPRRARFASSLQLELSSCHRDHSQLSLTASPVLPPSTAVPLQHPGRMRRVSVRRPLPGQLPDTRGITNAIQTAGIYQTSTSPAPPFATTGFHPTEEVREGRVRTSERRGRSRCQRISCSSSLPPGLSPPLPVRGSEQIPRCGCGAGVAGTAGLRAGRSPPPGVGGEHAISAGPEEGARRPEGGSSRSSAAPRPTQQHAEHVQRHEGQPRPVKHAGGARRQAR